MSTQMDTQTPGVGPEQVGKVMEYFAKNSHRHGLIRLSHTVTDDELKEIQKHCQYLLTKDYAIQTIPNNYGELCTSYPPELIIQERSISGRHGDQDRDMGPQINDANKLKPLMEAARFARAHGRFVFPVILVRGKNICRSGTISCNAETMLNNMQQRTKSLIYGLYGEDAKFETPDAYSIEEHRQRDIALLEELHVYHITDLMVEQRRRKLGVVVCSSEKAEASNRYRSQFNVMPIPFPGCEFFADFKRNDHNGNGLVFNWDLPELDAELEIPEGIKTLFPFDWSQQKSWDLTTLAQRYLQLMLLSTSDPDPQHGVLVHCISGWDRTPVFVSLLRMVLWAEGECHQSLSADEMLYLTIGYDWLLFSHHLSDRGNKGEDIFYFCFRFLEYIEDSDVYSLRYWTQRSKEYWAERTRLRQQRGVPPVHDTSDENSEAPHMNQVVGHGHNSSTSTSEEGEGDKAPVKAAVNGDRCSSDEEALGDDETETAPASPPVTSTAATTTTTTTTTTTSSEDDVAPEDKEESRASDGTLSPPVKQQVGFDISPVISAASAPNTTATASPAPTPASPASDTATAAAAGPHGAVPKAPSSLLSAQLSHSNSTTPTMSPIPHPALDDDDDDDDDDDARRVRAETVEPGADGVVNVLTGATAAPIERSSSQRALHETSPTPHSLNSGGGSWQMVSEHLRDTEFARRNRKDSDPTICASDFGDLAVSRSSLERSSRLQQAMNARAEAEAREKEWSQHRCQRLRDLRERFMQLYGQRISPHLGANQPSNGGWGLFKTLGIV